MTIDLAQGFCRDCLNTEIRNAKRCPNCGSPRLLRHAELSDLSLAHIDCDAFYASVEKRDRPELAGLPVIIGGGKRGVVTTACYQARIFGVRSAMPMFKALKLCPDAVIIRPDMAKYANIGRQIRAMMQELTPLVQPVSIDEAFLDLSGTERLHKAPPAYTLAQFARRIQTEIGITVSVGLSHNKFLAKMASDLNKPRGFSIIGQAETVSFLARQPVGRLPGVGPAFQAALRKDGIEHISDLQAMSEEKLLRRYGNGGQRLKALSEGRDDRKVVPDRNRKSLSSETTFNSDLSRLDELVPILRSLSEKIASKLKDEALAGQTVVLKLKTADFRSRTRNRTLADPTRRPGRIFDIALDLLRREADGTPFRLIGVGLSELVSDRLADPPDLVDQRAQRLASAEETIDQLRRRFGGRAVETGYTFGHKISRGVNLSPKDDDAPPDFSGES
ncbi:DNA polymerase IV [Notoacmeibacter sp. MSK16QG-6]|uniref:DNA polymerase IV n=1 Tax=Notoacmeibacter sp. MSK16QG-6 TaxID=2957982 RepID=UPI0020A02C83|nr:DNA polymerase IV [Notoacmeibacter sp. MSK16QG-6]MCP1197898.1 DNA polymerase IV [Notoacmeibacter sp. MSK16QG-6]